jgi:uncharacterized protein YdhG (YjbR/CyaY superfamily)
MQSAKPKPKTIDEFIAQYPKDIQEKLQAIRATIRKAAPKAEEAISYGIPAFKLNGNLIFFSAFKDHIGMHPRPKGLGDELSKYEGGKGTIKLPMTEALPLPLIRKIVKARIEDNIKKSEAKAKKKKA